MGMPNAWLVFLRAMLAAKVNLAVEKLALRQQIAVYGQSIKRPRPPQQQPVQRDESSSTGRAATPRSLPIPSPSSDGLDAGSVILSTWTYGISNINPAIIPPSSVAAFTRHGGQWI